uniref:phosphatase PAP2 family protein n=1 Tax=Thaumasiovibrio occultus TaxID=1891184 RepID=UPI00131DE358|nr:phosphatase PAP2 family protein [Thaumasiovibrio occultus]
MSFFSNKFPHFVCAAALFILVGTLLGLSPQLDLTSDISNTLGSTLWALSSSAGAPYFVIVAGLLCLLPLTLKSTRQQTFTLWSQFALLLILSFALKTGLKVLTEVPRPYTELISELTLTHTPGEFYQQNDEARREMLQAANTLVSPWRLQHWQGETDYSFPSGHTIFVAVCVVFWGGFLIAQQRYLMTALLILWATGVSYSRYYLGMHHKIDILAAILLGSTLMLFVPQQCSHRSLVQWFNNLKSQPE